MQGARRALDEINAWKKSPAHGDLSPRSRRLNVDFYRRAPLLSFSVL
jgi:hypothetical protein